MSLTPLGVSLADLVAQISARNRILFEAAELQHDGRLTLALQDDRSLHLIQVWLSYTGFVHARVTTMHHTDTQTDPPPLP